ncbi:DJ-1/PfpI family protein [Minwuia sp.]|uniref:DJ-1/PfpI family protein n=1 Tax=Minwuia sp. TaxID=2493630 RepID=UPI003A8F30B5
MAGRRIAIFVYDGVEPIDIGGTYGVFSMARRVVPDLAFFTVAETEATVTLSSGLRMLPDHTFAGCPAADALIVCGGPGWVEQRTRPAVLEFIRDRAPQGIIASVCTGGLILAATDLLDGLPATTRRAGIGDETPPLQIMGRDHAGITPTEALIVDCGHVMTGGGVSLAIDLSLHLLARLYDDGVRDDVAKVIEYDTAMRANARALPTLKHPA